MAAAVAAAAVVGISAEAARGLQAPDDCRQQRAASRGGSSCSSRGLRTSRGPDIRGRRMALLVANAANGHADQIGATPSGLASDQSSSGRHGINYSCDAQHDAGNFLLSCGSNFIDHEATAAEGCKAADDARLRRCSSRSSRGLQGSKRCETEATQ